MEIKHRLTSAALLVAFSVVDGVGYVAAARAWISTSVTRTYVSEDAVFGGCLIFSDAALSGKLNCRNGWVSLDCSGTLGGSKSEGNRKYQEVLLTQAMGGSIKMLVNDQKKINGWCVADRVQANR